ncbi:MAG: sulfatase-like hydrolase/transferase [Spirochaetes bacterium]|nr:sulfatase-like hydrolase/transferase [Spirochaetota bacterium]
MKNWKFSNYYYLIILLFFFSSGIYCQQDEIHGFQNNGRCLNTTSLESDQTYPMQNVIPRGKKYNIILYFFESFPAKYFDFKINGKYVVPNWRRLSENAFVAQNHYANFPLTANALFSVFASAYDPILKEPFEPGKIKNSETLTLVVKNYPTIPLKMLPETLKEHGYRTLYFHTWTLGYVGTRRFLQQRKFDVIMDMHQLKTMSPHNQKLGYGIDDRALIEPSIAVLNANRNTPFFAVYCPLSPHFPYPIPDESFNIAGPPQKNATFEEDCKRKYFNSLYYSDAILGMIIDRLEKENLLEDTLVFVFADHGQAFLEHKGNFRHRLGIYEENVHVPFLIYNKKLFPSKIEFNAVTSHIDIAPTVLDVLGIPPLPHQEGISMFAKKRAQMAIFQTYAPDHIMGVRDDRWKYLFNFTKKISELYDLSCDPAEQHNLASEKIDIVRRYHKVIEASYQHRINFYKVVMNGNGMM